MNFNWNHLRAFHAIANVGSMTKASGTLNISQSALSRQMLNLENRLRYKLFERTAKGLTLTAAGNRLYIKAGEIIKILDDVDEHDDAALLMLNQSIQKLIKDFINDNSLNLGGNKMAYELFEHENAKKIDRYFEKIIAPKGFIHLSFTICNSNSDWVDYAYNKKLGAAWKEKNSINLPIVNTLSYFTKAQKENGFFITNVLSLDEELNSLRRHFLNSAAVTVLAKKFKNCITFLALVAREEDAAAIFAKETPFLFAAQKQLEIFQLKALGL